LSRLKYSTIFRAIFRHFSNDTFRAWVGLFDVEEAGHFMWVDGVEAIPENTFWSAYAPNRLSSENCAVMRSSQLNYTLNDRDCSVHIRAICAKELLLV